VLFSPVCAKPHPCRTLASSSRLTFVFTPTTSRSLSKGSSNYFSAHAPEISPRSDVPFASRIGLSDLSSLERAITDKHRVLPVFSRNRPGVNPLYATFTSIHVCADSKWFTGRLSLLESAFTPNTGGLAASALCLRVSVANAAFPLACDPVSAPGPLWRPARPIAAQSLWCNNSQRHGIS